MMEGTTDDAARVLARVLALVARVEAVDEGDLRPETRLEQDLAMDSLSLVELQMALEEEFGLELPDLDVSMLKTIGDVAAAVAAAQQPAADLKPAGPRA